MIILRAEVEQIPSPSAPSSPQTLLSGLCASAKSNVAPLRLLFAKIFSSKIFLRGIIVFSIFMASGEAFAPFAIITAQAGFPCASAPQFAKPLAYGGEACVMRTSMVCCARTPNLEIAFFSGDFVTEGSALPWRCQERVNAGELYWKAPNVRPQRGEGVRYADSRGAASAHART